MKRGRHHRRGPSEQRARARGAPAGHRWPQPESHAAREQALRRMDARIRREVIGLIIEVGAILTLLTIVVIVTILLALLYFGLIVGLETLARLVPGQGRQSPVAITISTLAIVALSRPLLRRVQAVIDRRFYRHKYDAAQTIATFGARQRSEVDLDALSQHLMLTVQETMQPAHISLWLRPANTMRRPTPRHEARA